MTPDDEIAAGELALGLLDGDERAAAVRRTLAEPAFARAVERWREHFATLFVDWPEAAPRDGLWASILAALPREPGVKTVPHGQGVSPAWRWATGVATALAASLAAILLLRPAPVVLQRVPVPASAPAQLVAAIAPKQGAPFAAIYDRASGRLRIAGTVPVGVDRSAELWVIGGDGVPRSLGLLARTGTSALSLRGNVAARLTPGVTLAISVEPRGGSPKPTPTGPVVAGGTLQPA